MTEQLSLSHNLTEAPGNTFSMLFQGLHLSLENAEVTATQCPGMTQTNP